MRVLFLLSFMSVTLPVLALRQEYQCYPVVYFVTITTTTSTGSSTVSTQTIETEECGWVWVDDETGTTSGGGCKDGFPDLMAQFAKKVEGRVTRIEVEGDFDGNGTIEEGEIVNLSQHGLDERWFLQAVLQSHFKAIQLKQGPLPDSVLVLDLDGDRRFSHPRELLGNQFNLDLLGRPLFLARHQ